jgi:hypothetical protein
MRGTGFYSSQDPLRSRTPNLPSIAKPAVVSPYWGSPGRQAAAPRGLVENLRATVSGVSANPTSFASRCGALNQSTDSALKGLSEGLLPKLEDPDPQRYTIVFDLDETLVCNRRPGRAILRPHLAALLSAVQGKAEIVLWTASMECVARPVLLQMDPTRSVFHHSIFRDRRWFKDIGYCKDLRRLGRDISRCIIVENSPQSVRLNTDNAILVPDFFGNKADNSLKAVQEILVGLIESGKPVGEYLAQHPLLQRSPMDKLLYVRKVPLLR